jgi:hypothetical protein
MKPVDYLALALLAVICVAAIMLSTPVHAETKFIAIYDAVIDGEVHRIIDKSPYESRAACNLSAEVAVDRHRVLPWSVKAERIDITCEKLEWPEP